MDIQDHAEDAAKELAGNWQKFGSFAWRRARDLDDPGNWAIVYTHNRDSSILEQSNASVIARELEPFTEGDDPDAVSESHSHWACGWVDGYSIRVRGSDGDFTPAFLAYVELECAMEDYPVLDECDYSERELDAHMETLEWHGRSMINEDAPEDWAYQVSQSLPECDPDVSEETVREALAHFGWLESDDG